jgi:hypothetical protein
MRVDGRDAEIDDLEFLIGKLFAQEHFEITRCAQRRLRIAHGGGFAENKNALHVRRFLHREFERARPAREFRRKEALREPVVVDEIFFTVGRALNFEKCRIVAIARHAQNYFHQRQRQKRQG